MTAIEQYVKDQNSKVDAYISGVANGTIIANNWIKLAIKRYQKDLKRKDLVLCQEKVDHVFTFFCLLKINIKNEYKQFDLLPYQAFIIKNLFLFYYKDGRRRFRYSFVFISRKSGKTVFAVALNLYFLVGDGVKDPQCLLLASTREQATIALEYAKSIAKNSNFLRSIEIQRYQLKFDYGDSRGMLKTLASNSERLDGYSPSGAILDEIHSYPDDSLFKVIKSGILARQNPMIMLISTAGFMMDSFCFEMVETGKNVLKGTIVDDSFFFMLFTLDDNDDWRNPENWIKSNPGIGATIDIKDLKIEYNQAVNRPSELSNFKTKNLNLFVETSDQWIEENVLAKSYQDIDVDLAGRKCYAAFDLASTKDLVSLTLLFDVDGFFYSKFYFFLPNNPEKKLRKGGVNLAQWVDKAFIVESKTKTLDYDLVFDTIEKLSKEFDIISMTFDPFNSALLVPKIEDLGINCIPFKQTAMSFNFPLKFMEKQFYDENLVIGKNPVARWMFRNVVLYVDGNGNIKIVKNKSLDSVDGAVSLGMCFGGWIADNLDVEKMGIEAYLNNNT
jgi:phage terminase large subunit-like protein